MPDQIHLTLSIIGSEEKETESVRTGKHLWHLTREGRKSWSLLWGFRACPGETNALLDHRWERQLKKPRAFPGARVWKDSVFFIRGWPLGNQPCSKWVYGPHKLDLVVFSSSLSLIFFSLGKGWTWEDWELNVIGVHYVKLPNNKILHKKKIFQGIYYTCSHVSNGKITKS